MLCECKSVTDLSGGMDSNYVCVPRHLYQIPQGMGSKKLEFSRNLSLGEKMADVLGGI